jgi:hypothetical protein
MSWVAEPLSAKQVWRQISLWRLLALVAVVALVLGMAQPALAGQGKTLRVLIVGQGLAANCHEKVHGPYPGVYQLDRQGREVPAKDPLIWATCNQGSVWMPFARKVIEAGLAERVVLMPVILPEVSLAQIVNGKTGFAVMDPALQAARQSGQPFDLGFWVAGANDGHLGVRQHIFHARRTLWYAAWKVPVRSWLIARHSSCSGQPSPTISRAQALMEDWNSLGMYPGPDVDQFDAAARLGSCTLRAQGQDILAQRWLQAWQTASDRRALIRQEALLNLFGGSD